MKINGIIHSAIGKNIFSTFLGVGIQLFTQIVLVPFYIVCWGNNIYSDWIVLSAITGFFSVTDIGFTTVTVNRFSLLYAEKKYDECNALLANSSLFLCVIFAFCFIVLGIILSVFDIVPLAGLHIMSRLEASIIIILFVFKIFTGMLGAVYNSIYRASSKASLGIMAVNTSRVMEGLFMVVCLLLRAPLIITAVMYVLPSFCLYLFLKFHSTSRIYHYKFHIKYANWRLFKSLIVPSFSFMALPLSQSLNTQGMTLIVNAFFGAEVVVLFNTTRTLANFAKSVIANFQNAIWPEFTVAFANKNEDKIRIITRFTFKITMTLAFVMTIGLVFMGDWVYEIWTRGRITFSLSLMSVFMLLVITDSLWSTARMTLNATNNHIKMGPAMLVVTIVAITLSYFVGKIYVSLIIIVLCLIIVDIVMAPIIIKQSLKLTKDKFYYWISK